MEHESDCIKCSFCCIQNVRLYRLTRQELLLVEKLFTCLSMQKSSNISCSLCLEKLYGVKSFLKEIILSQSQYPAESTHAKKTPNRKMEKKDDEEQHIDSYNCRCTNCQTKFGSLPLLVDVIEQNQQKTSPAEPQPSTSYETSPRGSKKPMKCPHCDKVFTHKGDLNKHLRKHTGEQPFACKICDKKFAHTSNLARHMRLHSGDRPFSCEYCDKQFSRKDKLDLHKRSKVCQRV